MALPLLPIYLYFDVFCDIVWVDKQKHKTLFILFFCVVLRYNDELFYLGIMFAIFIPSYNIGLFIAFT